MTIKILAPQIANQIAAGEVVERPASVIKELLENAIDAGGTQIDVSISSQPTVRLSVTDNGSGIPESELTMALLRHATSKVSDLADLTAIETLGFRGEALASISAVSSLTLTSKPSTQKNAFAVKVHGLDCDAIKHPAAHPNGTTVSVEDLFFNVPARRKFLSQAKTERLHIESIFQKIALSHFDIGLRLSIDDKLRFDLPPIVDHKRSEQRLSKLFGKQFSLEARPVNQQRAPLSLTGWVFPSTSARRAPDRQFFFVNQRVVRDKLLMHAINMAFEGQLSEGYYPSYILYLTLPVEQVDVNVHPTKHEVRFEESRQVHDFVLSALKRSLNEPSFGSTNQINFTSSVQPIPYKPITLSTTHAAALNKNSAMMPHATYVQKLSQQGPYRLLIYQSNCCIINQAKAAQSLANVIEPVKQPLLFPVILRLSDAQSDHYKQHQAAYESLGFELRLSTLQNYQLIGVPKGAAHLNLTHWFEATLSRNKSKAKPTLSVELRDVEVLSDAECLKFLPLWLESGDALMLTAELISKII